MLENPVRARLIERAREWQFLGAVVPGYPDLHPLEEGYWESFWKIYVKLRGAESPPPAGPPP